MGKGSFSFGFSGGILYHWRALRYLDSLWTTHRRAVSNLLEKWNPKSKTLVVIGTSGGYSLPKEFFNRFTRVIAYEPDFIARKIFEKRMEFKPEWRRKWSVEPSFEPGAAVLFCNMLGQISLKPFAFFKTKLHAHLEGHEWASFQDAYSGNDVDYYYEPTAPVKAKAFELRKSIQPRLSRSDTIEVNEHTAFELFDASPQLRFTYWQWNLTSTQSHLIEGVFRVGLTAPVN